MGDHVAESLPENVENVDGSVNSSNRSFLQLQPREYLKASAAALGALVASLLMVLTGNETLADVTTAEWLMCLANTLGVFGITYKVPNLLRK